METLNDVGLEIDDIHELTAEQLTERMEVVLAQMDSGGSATGYVRTKLKDAIEQLGGGGSSETDLENLGADIAGTTDINATEGNVEGKTPVAYSKGDIFYIGNRTTQSEKFDGRTYYVSNSNGTAGTSLSDTSKFYSTTSGADAVRMSQDMKKGAANGVASLDGQGVIPQSQVNSISLAPQTLNETQKVQAQNNMVGKSYAPTQHSGLGRVFLQKGDGYLRQSMMPTDTGHNTVYVIQYDFTLATDIYIPSNCVLLFEGGSLGGNHTLVGNNSTIDAGNDKIFDNNIMFDGTWSSCYVNVLWFGAVNNISIDSTDAFKAANRAAWGMATVGEHHQIHGEVKEICVDIPTGNYSVSGNKIFGSVRNEDDYTPSSRLTTKYSVKGNDSIIYWNVSNKEDVFARIDYTISEPYFRDMKIYVISDNNSISKGIVFDYGNGDAYPSIISNDNASMGIFRRLNITSGRNSNNISGVIYKVFNIGGKSECDLALVEQCYFSYFETLWYCTNSEAVGWYFNKCGFFTNISNNESVTYFYISQLSEQLTIINSSFSVLRGQTIIKYDSDEQYYDGLQKNILIGTYKDNIIFHNNRIEIYENSGYDYINMFEGNAGCLKMKDINFTASVAATTQIRFLLSDGGTLQIEGCIIPKCLMTLPKITNKITGTSFSLFGITLYNTEITNLNLKGYDWESKTILPFIDCYKDGLFRVATFNDFKTLYRTYKYSFDITPTRTVGSSWQLRTYSQEGTTASGYFFGSLAQYIILPPFSVIKKIELINKPYTPNYTKVKTYFGDLSGGNYVLAEIPKEATEVVTIFEGTAIIFKEDISLQKIQSRYLYASGTENDNDSRGQIVITYCPLLQKAPIEFTTEETYISQGCSCALKKGDTASRPTGETNNGVLSPSRDIGFEYFDTDLGLPIYVSSINSTTGIVTWIKADGTLI